MLSCRLPRSQSAPFGRDMRRASDYVQRKPQTVIVSSVSSAAIEIQAARVELHTIFKVTKLWNDFRGRTFTIHELGYPKVGYERVSRYTFFILVIDIIIGIWAQLNEYPWSMVNVNALPICKFLTLSQ